MAEATAKLFDYRKPVADQVEPAKLAELSALADAVVAARAARDDDATNAAKLALMEACKPLYRKNHNDLETSLLRDARARAAA
ncbi:MAG TPA: hypothetical protein VLF67_04030 [Candidatus Saccharimonas sp.]|nr:hypothetical protein [Candidatus Saccharimonas sp.]